MPPSAPSAISAVNEGDRTRATPAPPPDARDLPHAITFFVNGRDRAVILRALRRIDGDRVFALKRALGLE